MSLQACAENVAEGDPARFRVVMTMPLPLREKLLPILAFNLEVARAPYVTAEPMIARIRLQWWRDCLDEIFAGGDVRAHDVAHPLAAVIRAVNLPKKPFTDMLDARETDIEGFDFETWDTLWGYLDVSGGALLEVLGLAAGIDRPARDNGTGFAAAGWLRAVPDLSKRGGRVLPNPEEVPQFADGALHRISGCGSLQPISRFGYLVPYTLKKAGRDPSAVLEGRLEPHPLRAQMAFLRSLY
ncbi:MAG: squalene/phytoene synthase family protein [Pseudomonadota bacterium]